MKHPVVSFGRDSKGDWVARLSCGHNQHVRHDPPWQDRSWVLTAQGRERHLGHSLDCAKCDRNEPKDPPPPVV